MPTNKGVIRAPVSIEDVRRTIGDNSTDVGTLCRSSKINRWAIYKPEKINKVGMITLNDRKDNNMGLTPVTLARLKNSNYHIATAQNTVSEVESEIRMWDYQPPTGGNNSPYRLSDFVNDTLVTSNGYNHEAKPCDADWTDMEVSRNGIQSLTYRPNFSAKLTEDTSSILGSANNDFMPLSYVADTQSDWRIGYAIFDDGFNRWHFVISNMPLGNVTSSNASQAAPNFSTNRYACRRMYDLTTLLYKDFVCVPFLMKINSGFPNTAVEVGAEQLSSITPINTTIYAMPSGQKRFSIRINTPLRNVNDNNNFKLDTFSNTYHWVIPFNENNGSPYYMIKGYENSYGRTTCGWFITDLYVTRVSTTGDAVRQYAIVFCTIPKDGNRWEIAQPMKDGNGYDENAVTVAGRLLIYDGNKGENQYISVNATLTKASTAFVAGVTIYGVTIGEPTPRLTYISFNNN